MGLGVLGHLDDGVAGSGGCMGIAAEEEDEDEVLVLVISNSACIGVIKEDSGFWVCPF